MVTKNPAEAAEWYRKAAGQGNAVAQYFLGISYAAGEGVPQDLAEAARLWRMSAERGYSPAQFELGAAFQQGRGVARDHAEAVKWYRKAAEQDDLSAEYYLAIAYDKGEGVGKDKTEAAKWWTKVAERGDPNSAFDLGQMYAKGEGLPGPDPQKACMWFIIVDKLYHEEIDPAIALLQLRRDPSLSFERARAMNKEIEKQSSRAKKALSREQLREAERQAQDWFKEHRPVVKAAAPSVGQHPARRRETSRTKTAGKNQEDREKPLAGRPWDLPARSRRLG